MQTPLDFFHRLIAFRPASRRAVAQLRQDVRESNDRIIQQLNRIADEQTRRFDHTWVIEMDSRRDAAAQNESLQQTLDSFDTRTMAYLHQLYFSNRSDMREAAIELFAAVPAADGPQRIYQLALAKLMYVLDQACAKHGISYWLCWGALLASRTRKGSIPWDDDIDICLLRKDLDKLRALFADDEQYQVSVVYDRYVLCRQYRFSSRNANNPCFIDLCVFDWAPSPDASHDKDLKTIRYELMDDLNRHMDQFPLWQRYPYLFTQGDDDVVQAGDSLFTEQDLDENMKEIARIDEIFDRHRNKAMERHLITDEPNSPAVSYGLENIMDVPSRTMLFPTKRIFPTVPMRFEGYSLQVPNDCDYMLDQCYPGWPYLPKNMYGHRHFDRQQLHTSDVLDTLKSFISETDE